MSTTWQDRLAAAVAAERGVRLSAEESVEAFAAVGGEVLDLTKVIVDSLTPVAVEPYDVPPWSSEQEPSVEVFKALGNPASGATKEGDRPDYEVDGEVY